MFTSLVFKLKIIFINRFFYPDQSATSQILSDLAFYLASEKKEVEVVTSRQKYNDPQAFLPTRENIKGVLIRRVWSTRFGRAGLLGRSLDYLSFYISVFFCLLGDLKKNDLVVAETDPPLISVVAMMAAGFKGAKLIHWTQDIFPEVAIELRVKIVRWLAPFFQWMRDMSFKSAVMNVAIGEKMAEVIRSRGVQASRIRVIHNWSDGTLIKPLAREENRLRREWGFGDKFVVGYSGNMGRAHEFQTILEAARSLSSCANILFLFIGDGKQRQSIEEWARQKNIANIVLKPYQPYELLGQSLTAADAHLVCLKPELEGLIVPSKFYGILAAGRPVLNIGSECGEVGAWIRKIGCGYTVDPGQAAKLSELILRMADDRAGVAGMGKKGREFFEQHFDRPLALKAWYDVVSQSPCIP